MVLGFRKKIRKVMAAVLSTALLLPAWTGIALAAESKAAEADSGNSATVQVHSYQDTAVHWSRTAVEAWSNYGVIQGYEDGSFKPDQAVTRGEFAAMLQNISRYVETGNNVFSDVTSADWFYEAVTKLHAAGILEGSGGNANPRDSITRQEAAVLLARAFQLKQTDHSAAFTDKAELAPWATAAVGELAKRSVLKGFPDGSFKPQATLTRAEATALFNQLLAQLYSKPGTYTGDIAGNVLVNTADVTLKGMTISGDLYIAQGVGEGEVHLDGVTINGTVYVQGGGEHSILFNNVNVKGALVVNKYNGKVRLVASGSTNVSVTLLETGAMLVTRELSGGGFESVTIAADVLAGQLIVLDGTFNKVTNQSAAASITASGTIKELVAEAATKLKGEVKVEKVSTKDNAAVTINDKPQTTAPAPVGGGSVPGSSGGSSPNSRDEGGNSSGGGGDDDSGSTTVAVTGVSLSEKRVTLQVGETKELSAAVTPSNATNKNVTWSVYGGSSDVITVSSTGLVTAKAPGVKEVVVKTQNGGFEAKTVVTVEKAVVVQKGLGVKAKVLTSAIKDPNAEIDGVLMENGKRVEITGTIPSVEQPTFYTALMTAKQPLIPMTVGQAVYAVYAVIQLTDAEGAPIADTSGFHVSVNGAVYSADFGTGLSEENKAGSFLYLIDAGNPEGLTTTQFAIWKEGTGSIQFKLTYAPESIPVLKAIGTISGNPTVGETLIAGKLQFSVDAPAIPRLGYQWLRSKEENTGYELIREANSATYVVRPEDTGYFIRVLAGVKEQNHTVTSEALGPVTSGAVLPEDVYAAINAIYLNGNASKNSISKDLLLPVSLDEYPGVQITWSSSNSAVVTENGVVQQGDTVQTVTLTAVLSGAATGTQSYVLTVLNLNHMGLIVKTSQYVDPSFAEGYPQAYIKDGTLRVKFALNRPGEVYAVVHQIKTDIESQPDAVVNGYLDMDFYGNSYIYNVNDWPYAKIASTDVGAVQEWDTGYQADSGTYLKVEFVVKDGDYLSAQTTALQLEMPQGDGQPQAYPTTPYGYANVNKSKNAIYLYFYGELDGDYPPAPSDFVVEGGKVASATLHYKEEYRDKNAGSYIKLDIIPNPIGSLQYVEYRGSSLQDAANGLPLSYFKVYIGWSDQALRSYLAYDRQHLSVYVDPGWRYGDNLKKLEEKPMSQRFTVKVGDQEYQPSQYRSDSLVSYAMISFDKPLPEGEAVVTFDGTGLTDWAGDSYPETALSTTAKANNLPGAPAASYEDGMLTLQYAEGFSVANSSNILAAGLILDVDGTEYALRGQIIKFTWNEDSRKYRTDINLNDKWSVRYKEAVEKGANVSIKYKKMLPRDYYYMNLYDQAGVAVPDFDYVPVVKK